MTEAIRLSLPELLDNQEHAGRWRLTAIQAQRVMNVEARRKRRRIQTTACDICGSYSHEPVVFASEQWTDIQVWAKCHICGNCQEI